MRGRIASNAAANIVNGMTMAGFVVGMTAIIARFGRASDLQIWSLAASIAGFAPLLGCNLSLAVTRRLTSSARSVADPNVHNSIVMVGARSLVKRLCYLGFAISVVLAIAAPYLYPKVMPVPYWPASLAICSCFVGMCWTILIQPEQGWLMTEYRNWPVAGSGMVARGAGFAVSAAALLLLGFPVWLAIVLGSATLWSGVWYIRRQVPSFVAPQAGTALSNEAQEIGNIGGSFAAWNITSAAIQTSTVPIVGLIAANITASFFLSFTLISIIMGVAIASANALVAPLAHMLGKGDLAAVERAALHTTFLLWCGLIVTFVAVYFLLPLIISIWVGSHNQTVRLDIIERAFVLLALQQGLRSTAIVSTVLLAMGARPRTMFYLPLVEFAGFMLIALPLAIWAGPFAYLLGLAAAGGVGAVAVVWFTKRQVLGGQSVFGKRLVLLVIGLQIATVLICGTLPFLRSTG